MTGAIFGSQGSFGILRSVGKDEQNRVASDTAIRPSLCLSVCLSQGAAAVGAQLP